MKKTAVLLIIASTILITSCRGNRQPGSATDSAQNHKNKTLRVHSQDFEIDVPKGWEQKETVENGVKMLFFLGPKTGNYQPNINVLKDFMKGQTLDGYIESNLKNMQAMNINNQKSGSLNVGGLAGRYLTYNYNYQGRDIFVKSYIIPNNDVAYVVTATCLDGQRSDFSDLFDETVNTLKIK